MTQEEKAKAYDEAFEYAHHLINERCKEGTDGSFHRVDLQKMFPELKESEDERIRKRIIHLVNKSHEQGGYALHKDEAEEMIAYLEKQGEHANFRNKIQIGDKVTRNRDGVLVNLSQLNRVAKDEKQGEQKPALSEEDEKNINELIRLMEQLRSKYISESHCYPSWGKLVNWLKSLKDRVQPQTTWKPSDEHIKAVKEAACYSSVFSEKTIDNLISLSKQLNKLREE